MKFKNFLKHLTISSGLLLLSPLLIAKTFTCPSLDELKGFEGFYVEYPMSIDIQTQEPNKWLVAQLEQKKDGALDALIISPVIAEQNEYPNDAALRMIDYLQPYKKSNDCVKELQLCICYYWNPDDGSFASFVHSGDIKRNQLNPLATIQIASTMWQKVQSKNK